MAPLLYAAKFDPFLALDCAPRPPPWRNPRKGRDEILPSRNHALRKQKRPDLQFHTSPFDHGVDHGAALRHVFGWNHTVWDHIWLDHPFVQFMGAAPSLLRPKSRGSVTLGGPSIHDAPVIDPNYLAHPDDIRTLVEGLKFLKRVEETELFKKHEMLLAEDKILCGDRHGMDSLICSQVYLI